MPTEVALFANDVHIEHYKSGSRDLVFIDGKHVGTPRYFADVQFTVDSLKKQGYILVFEEIRAAAASHSDSIKRDVLLRKVRKVAGIYGSDYSDRNENQSLGLSKKGKNLIAQTAENTGINTTTDIWADYSLGGLITAYERERGEIILSECDWKTGKNEKYKCSKVNLDNAIFLIQTLRNKRLVKIVDSLHSQKVAILYGAAHRSGFFKLLREKDSTWVHQKRKNYY